MQFEEHLSRTCIGAGIALALLAASPAFAAGLIGVDGNGNLYDVNQSTGTVSNSRPTASPMDGIAFSPSGTLYGMTNPKVGQTFGGYIYTINPATGAASQVGAVNLFEVYEGDIAFDPTTGNMFGIEDANDGSLCVFSINPSTGAGTDLNNCPASQVNLADLSAMAFDSSGNMYVIDTGNSLLLRINKNTGALISTVNLSLPGQSLSVSEALGSAAGMAIDPATGIAYLATGFGTNALFTLNLVTGTLTTIGPLTGASSGLTGIAFPPLGPTALSITKTHAGDFTQGQNGAQYTVTVSNAGLPTKGVVTVTDTLPAGLSLVSMSGSGWNCTSNTCTRTDAIGGGNSYPAISVSVNVSASAASQVTNQVNVSGGNSASASATDLTNIDSPACTFSFSNSPATLGAGASSGIAQLSTSGSGCPYTGVISNNPDWITITSGATGSGAGPIGFSATANTSGAPRQGSFTVVAKISGVTLGVATFNVNQAAADCSALTVTPNSFTFGQSGGSGVLNFNTSPCSWTVTGAPSWITLPASSGNGPSLTFNVGANPSSTNSRQATLSINGGALTVAIQQSGLVCTFNITDSSAGFGISRSFTSSGGGGGMNVDTPNGCSWSATSSQPFITFGGSSSGNGNGGIGYQVSSNPSSNSGRTGTISVAGLEYIVSEQASGAPAYTCSANAGAPPSVRPEGFSEKVADIVLSCSGNAPSGGILGDIRISFSTDLTNRLLSSSQTDALLLEDEPSPANLALGVNAFRGVLTSISGSNALLFPAVQIAPASGGTFLHTWRITNARVNAQALNSGEIVQASIAITASAPFTVNGQPNVAVVGGASSFSTGTAIASSGQTTQPVSFTEGFATAFAPNLLAGQDPSTPGTVYNSESGFVNTAKLGSQTGFATNGTRLITSITGVPSGVTVYAPATPAAGNNAQITSADTTGSGGFPVPGTTMFNGISYRPVAITSGAGAATWEVTSSNSTKIETLTFNLLFVNPNNVSLSGVSFAGALAPVTAGSAAQLPSTTLPVPRFASSSIVVPQPATVTLSVLPKAVTAPIQGQLRAGSLQAALRSASTPSSSVVGGTVTWTQVQANTGSAGSTTAPTVTVGGTLPPTWAITSCTALDSTGVCPSIDPNNPSNSYSVTFPSLSPGQTGTIQLTAQSTTQTSGSVEYASTIDSDLANADSTDNSFTTNFPVAEIGLNVSLTNSSSFTQGQNGAVYSASVANGGSLPTSLPVTLTEVLPAGLTLVSMAGTGWTCTLSSSSCTRSDVLAPNSSFPAVTITVNVASNAASTVTNQVTASSGVLVATGSDPTNIAKGSGAPAAFFNGETSLGSNVYYLQFPNSNLFGYYNLQSFPIFYHYDMGFEAFIDGGNGAAYLYDFTTGHWWYTSSSLFPYLYDFSLNNWLYYFPATNNPGHYSSNPRTFSDLTTGKIITM